MKNESGVTEMKDKDYGLVSILYHSLKGAKSCIQFKAEAADDEELEQIFEEIYQEHTERANRVKSMLMSRISEGNVQGSKISGTGRGETSGKSELTQ
jgi:hypothetical protein